MEQQAAGATPAAGPSSSDAAAPMRSPLAAKAARLLHRRLRVKVMDGRVLVGEFICLDKQGNIILTNTYEQLQTSDGVQEKQMGQVLIPVQHQVSCEVEAMPQERQAFEQLLAVGEEG